MEWLDNLLSGIGSQLTGQSQSEWLPLLLALGGGLAGVAGGNNVQRVGYQGEIPRYTATRTTQPINQDRRAGGIGQRYFSDVEYAPKQMATGGLTTLPQARGFYLGGATDGMADKIPATINGSDPAALSDGEFVVPADVVSGLGNGNSNAGAMQLYAMLDRVREARTGTTEQGRQVDASRLLPN